MEKFFFSTWWVLGIFVLSLSLFERGTQSIDQDLSFLNQQVEELEHALAREEETHHYLQDRLSSFEDPLWIELLLIKNLGLIPEGYRKYVLIESNS